MGDIFGIAKTSLDIVGAGLYVDTKAESDDLQGTAVELVSSLVKPSLEDKGQTNFIMVTGEAGAGKTSVLKELVRKQAQSFMSGLTDYVYLYVNAQGRALARFNEALATELNELRVWLPHSAVSVLVKLELIVPIIDGFDELLGVGGYDDAFSSISSFVEDLDGKGAMVASARSTYYEQEFLSRASRTTYSASASWKLTSVAVAGWSEEERRAYVKRKVEQRGGSEFEDAYKEISRVFSGENEALAKKPLFVARTTDFFLEGLLEPDGRFLLDSLVDAFVNRERKEKLLKKSGDSILDSDQIKGLCSDIAEEMWNLGTRELDRASVRELTELALCDIELTVSEKSIVQERTSNMAFLQPGEALGAVSFEHEIFFDYFLASRIAAAICANGPSLNMLLGRSAMPDSLAGNIAANLSESDVDVNRVASALCQVASKSAPRQQLVKENAGKLVGSLFEAENGVIGDISLSDLVFPGSSFRGAHFNRVVFSDCDFRRCDLTEVKFTQCKGERVMFDLPLVSAGTVLDFDGVEAADFFGIRQAADSGIRICYEPRDVLEILREMGLPSLEGGGEDVILANVPGEVQELIGRLVRAYTKCNPLCLQDDYLGAIFSSDIWPQVLKAGEESGVLRMERRAANGPRREFVRRLVRPEDLAAGAVKGANVPAPVIHFWSALERSFSN